MDEDRGSDLPAMGWWEHHLNFDKHGEGSLDKDISAGVSGSWNYAEADIDAGFMERSDAVHVYQSSLDNDLLSTGLTVPYSLVSNSLLNIPNGDLDSFAPLDTTEWNKDLDLDRSFLDLPAWNLDLDNGFGALSADMLIPGWGSQHHQILMPEGEVVENVAGTEGCVWRDERCPEAAVVAHAMTCPNAQFKSFGPQSGLSEYSTLPMGTIHEANEQHCSTLSGFLADFRDQSSDRDNTFFMPGRSWQDASSREPPSKMYGAYVGPPSHYPPLRSQGSTRRSTNGVATSIGKASELSQREWFEPMALLYHQARERHMTKRRKRRFTTQERATISYKRRVGVCRSCRSAKRKCTHVSFPRSRDYSMD